MNTKFLRTALKPVMGIFLLSTLSVVFLTISSFNDALSYNIIRAEDFMSVVMADLEDNIEKSQKSLLKFHSEIPIEPLMADVTMKKNHSEALDGIYETLFCDCNITQGIVVLKNNQVAMLTSKYDFASKSITYSYYDEMWMENKIGTFRYHLIEFNDREYLMIEMKLKDQKDYSLGMILDFQEILPEHFAEHQYSVHLLARTGKHLVLGKNEVIISELQNIYSPTVFNDIDGYHKNKAEMTINDFNYYDGHIITSDQYYSLTLVVTKPYDKYTLNNTHHGLTTRIVIFGMLVTAVIATIVYSSQKTNKWIDADKQFLNDIIEMDKIQIAELKKELKFYKDYFMESKLPIMFIDKETFRVVNANKSALIYYDYNEEEMNDLYLTDICKWDTEDISDVVPMEHIKRSGVKDYKTVRLQDGSFNDVELLIMMVISDQLSEIDHDKLKMEMFHEVRSPLQGAFGAVEMIEKATDNFGEYTNIIKRSLSNVLTMTNNVLAHGKLSHQKSRVLYSDFDLVQVVNEVISTTVYQDKHYNLIAGQVQENVDDVLVPMNSYTVNSDGIKLRQILLNLMSNASKYTIDGMINMTVDITRKDDKDILVFRVTDTGTGLSKDEIDQIFEAYTTFSQNSNVQSTGIGMGITKRYIEMLGSELHINSEKGVGSTFSFSLEVKGTKRSAMPDGSQKSILVVDDDEISCDYLKHLLEKEMSCYVKTLTNESTLFSELNHNHYDCLIIDQNLNHFNGVDMVRLIKSSINKRLVEMPIVLITASRTTYELKQLSDAQVDEIILKPFENDEVVKILESIFISQTEYKHTACQFVDETIIDKAVLCETYEAVGKEVFVELVYKFNANSTDELAMIRERAQQRDYERIGGMLHRLKGSMSYFAPIECQRLLAQLETLAQDQSESFLEILEQFEKAHQVLLIELKNISRHI